MSTSTSLNLTGPAKFLGAYINNINSSLGFGTNPSNCSVSLLEDEHSAAIFTPPILGQYYKIEAGPNWSFGGVAIKYDKDISNVSGRQIQLTLNDVREIMKNIPVILAPGSSLIAAHFADTECSLLDIFGAYTYQGAYNISGWNQAGMPYHRVASALHGEIVTIGATLFPVPKQIAKAFGERYSFDFSEVSAKVNNEYRLNTNLVSISELIEEMASKNSFDWRVESSRGSDGIINIVIKVIDRAEDNTEISFQEFLDSHGSIGGRVISAVSGLELRNELSCLALQGAPVESLTKVAINGMANEPIDLSPEGGSSEYYMTETEMRAVLYSKETWKMWVTIPTEFGGGQGFSRYGGSLVDDDLQALVSILQLQHIGEDGWTNKQKTKALRAQASFEKVGKIYDKLRASAEANYGKRFVHDPVYDEIIDSAWTRGAIGGNDDPNEYFRQDDGRTRAYVEYSNEDSGGAFSLGLSDLQNAFTGTDLFSSVISFGSAETFLEGSATLPLELKDSFLTSSGIINTEKSNYVYNNSEVQANGTVNKLYVACTVDKDGTVRIDAPVIEVKPDLGQFVSMLLQIQAQGDSADYTDADGNHITSDAKLKNAISRIYGETPFIYSARAFQPKYVYLPTRSKVNRYGPVFSSEVSHRGGKLQIIQDDGFAPWEFGSVSTMNTAMQIKVDEASSAQTDIQVGNVEVEGYPVQEIGASIGQNSNITNVNITWGAQGVKTSYSLASFTRKFGEFSKEDFARLALFAINAGARTLPQQQISFVYRHNFAVNKQFSGRGQGGSGANSGGAHAF